MERDTTKWAAWLDQVEDGIEERVEILVDAHEESQRDAEGAGDAEPDEHAAVESHA